MLKAVPVLASSKAFLDVLVERSLKHVGTICLGGWFPETVSVLHNVKGIQSYRRFFILELSGKGKGPADRSQQCSEALLVPV